MVAILTRKKDGLVFIFSEVCSCREGTEIDGRRSSHGGVCLMSDEWRNEVVVAVRWIGCVISLGEM